MTEFLNLSPIGAPQHSVRVPVNIKQCLQLHLCSRSWYSASDEQSNWGYAWLFHDNWIVIFTTVSVRWTACFDGRKCAYFGWYTGRICYIDKFQTSSHWKCRLTKWQLILETPLSSGVDIWGLLFLFSIVFSVNSGF